MPRRDSLNKPYTKPCQMQLNSSMYKLCELTSLPTHPQETYGILIEPDEIDLSFGDLLDCFVCSPLFRLAIFPSFRVSPLLAEHVGNVPFLVPAVSKPTSLLQPKRFCLSSLSLFVAPFFPFSLHFSLSLVYGFGSFLASDSSVCQHACRRSSGIGSPELH